MTAACPGGGASQLAPGAGQQVVFSAGLITAGLALISPWLIPFAGLIDSFSYQALTQCTGDPPPMPTAAQLSPTNAVGGVLNPNFQSWLAAVNNLLLNWAWTQYCVCVGGAATPPTYPAPPANVSIPVLTNDTPCLQQSAYGALFDYHTNPPIQNDLPGLCWPGTSTVISYSGTNTSVIQMNTPIPSSFQLTGSVPSTDSLQRNITTFVRFFDAGNVLVQNNFQQFGENAPGTNPISLQAQVPTTAKYVQVTCADTYGIYNAGANFQLQMQWGCAGGSAVGAPTSCCQDPQTLEMLSTILGLLEGIYAATPSVVRNYSEGTVHPGLTGAGTLTIAASTIAIRVNITTDLPGGRIDLGSPNYLFDRGYVVQVAAEAPLRGYSRIVYNPQVFKLDPICEQIGYTLPPGETISVTELSLAP